MIPRTQHLGQVLTLLETVPCVAILGARQVGKTTLASAIADAWAGPVHRFDLERQADAARLAEPELALEALEGLIILDEVQRVRDIFSALRVFIDRHPQRRVLVLGSAGIDLLRQSAETLAGRIAYHDLSPLTVNELSSEALDDVWIRGGFPRSYLAPDEAASFRWRLDFIRTFIERDLPSLGVRTSAATLDRFWHMLAHVHSQVWVGTRFASAFGVSDKTVRSYLDLLTSAMVIRQLPPWHENVGKRQVRSPKVYLRDSGLLHALLDLPDRTTLERHPIVGASWEGFVIEQVLAASGARTDQCYFWATHSGAEIDLLIVRGVERVGFEIKRTVSPRITPSIRSARETLRLDRTYLVHAGGATYPMSADVEAVAAADLAHRREF